ncbi:MAG: 1-deoxy-D-xylulose-5-phosphate synthase [Hydrogenophilales bacterium CG03_land_8_20_14_0_80_62_28]|nr:1-deoxy-D-xylulose-5-phosphate synthase [Betaproteobacteria bacterium]OIO78840.1 MAG: 1-deoxy-D-xylulose-5-phosphate synthase [Hydrogenophilaceae bacterium CG1_02_62_390]PIV23720.1 MAG: 1-deoxy-D-xylulose-5-phosphate synthase [Hydrogenophilales bacterium CG03_land_8_20_14_0_80_62_28]PIW38600.1 MAG: 1-deoxy-D-xylulose-5-phosphate synthase [Hydrogenophilales bacterium CG15_BIG_FIL_POST_REV_8_21_14_020_62_31]PIW71434.1 MAG: 1-deoxy-D-xylulose-5-phosphate synthase [Hydrogenophilales bacterium CG
MTAPILDRVGDLADLKQLSRPELKQLADELRAFIIETVSKTGGHLASNLGVVELTIALHVVFDTPRDKLVWDVGHQTYAHKILTGRKARMATLRQTDGLSGFPKREESAYDAFGAGHSSTSISAALGMATAAKLKGEDFRTVAVIGDGAMTAGMAFEALNNAGAMDANLLVILNDNEMSISHNVGALNTYLTKLMSGRFYNAMRRGGEKVLAHLPPFLELAKKAEEHMKGMVTPGTLFEEFGFNYLGPIDGHDIDALIDTLANIKKLSGPQFLHIVTQKGRGYAPAEANPCGYHGVGKFDPEAGLLAKTSGKPTYTQVFSDWLTDMAALDDRLVAITPAMGEGSGLVAFAEKFPERYFDVGIAEQHALTFAAGLACEGMKPVVAIYSTFLQRAYDQLIHDIALQDLPVMLAIDRGGLVGADGPTHAGAYDLSFLRCVPNILIAAPSDENECRRLLTTAYRHNGPSAVRYPRGVGPGALIDPALEPLPIGQGSVLRQGARVAILAFGSPVATALKVAEALDATVADMRFIKPLDEALIRQLAETHDYLVTVEENAIMGGAGSAVAEALAAMGLVKPLLHLGLPDRFVEPGDPAVLLARCGLDGAGMESAIGQFISE